MVVYVYVLIVIITIIIIVIIIIVIIIIASSLETIPENFLVELSKITKTFVKGNSFSDGDANSLTPQFDTCYRHHRHYHRHKFIIAYSHRNFLICVSTK